jgi:hypothetical protein
MKFFRCSTTSFLVALLMMMLSLLLVADAMTVRRRRGGSTFPSTGNVRCNCEIHHTHTCVGIMSVVSRLSVSLTHSCCSFSMCLSLYVCRYYIPPHSPPSRRRPRRPRRPRRCIHDVSIIERKGLE